jgi:hypothetical protein
MEQIEVGSLVILHCAQPKEKIWGVLVRIDAIGIVIRGLDLSSVEDWLEQERQQAEPMIGPSTQLVPMHRVERIYLDESTPVIDSYSDRYRAACGIDVRDALNGRRPGDSGDTTP